MYVMSFHCGPCYNQTQQHHPLVKAVVMLLALAVLVAPWIVTTTSPVSIGGGRVGPVAVLTVFIPPANNTSFIII